MLSSTGPTQQRNGRNRLAQVPEENTTRPREFSQDHLRLQEKDGITESKTSSVAWTPEECICLPRCVLDNNCQVTISVLISQRSVILFNWMKPECFLKLIMHSLIQKKSSHFYFKLSFLVGEYKRKELSLYLPVFWNVQKDCNKMLK